MSGSAGRSLRSSAAIFAPSPTSSWRWISLVRSPASYFLIQTISREWGTSCRVALPPARSKRQVCNFRWPHMCNIGRPLTISIEIARVHEYPLR